MQRSPMTEYERQQAEAIRRWKLRKPSVASKAVGLVAAPLRLLVRVVVPEKALLGALGLANSAARKLADASDILEAAGVNSLEDLQELELEKLDELANEA